VIRLILDHIWQSTLFAAAAGLLTLFFRTNSAGVRYGIWLSASLKFLFPLAILTAGGTALSGFLPSNLPAPTVMTTFDGAAQPFTSGAANFVQPRLVPAQSWDWTTTLAVIWLAGFIVIVSLWLYRWLGLRATVRSASVVAIDAPLPVRSSSSLLEPGIVGIFRPVLLLPTAIANQFSSHELDVLIDHELCHWRRQDNLTAALHMLVEAIFWFHPLVWWLESRLIAERECACDEAVLAMGREPDLYAESILKVCKHYVRSSLPCVAGISGADLKPRLERIMQNRAVFRMNILKKALLTTAATLIVVAPILAGLVASRQALAQTSGTLDGWGPFKFGMTLEQARAIPTPGLTWRFFPPPVYENFIVAPGDEMSGLNTRGPVKEFGFSFEHAGLEFTPKNGLVYIALTTNKTVSTAESSTPEACEDTFKKLLPALEEQYGTFGPHDLDRTVWSFSRSADHDIAGIKSQYLYTTDTRDTQQVYGFEMSASRVFGARHVQVMSRYTHWRDEKFCSTQVSFDDPSIEPPRPTHKPT
jgi:beta-lactamase regulating signal transducer with metallopeptidase domain